MPINLARIDDRLIHGQVITTWVKNHDIEQILIINDKVAGDSVQQSVITMSAPPELKVQVFGVQKFIDVLKKAEIKRRTMLLFTNSVLLYDQSSRLNENRHCSTKAVSMMQPYSSLNSL